MKHVALIIVLAIVGVAVGWARTKIEFAGHKEFFVVYYDPKGESAGPTVGFTPEAAAKAVVEGGKEFDFGAMNRDDKMKHDFVVKNEGTAPLELRIQNTTCKCTLAELSGSTVAPGESTIITLEWKPDSYAVEFSQIARIKTNDPEQDVMELRVLGRVIQPIWTDPREVAITSAKSSEGFSAKVRMFTIAEDAEIIGHSFRESASAEYLSAEFTPIPADDPILAKEKAGSGFDVTITARPGLPIEPVIQDLKVETNIPNTDDFELPIRAAIEGDITITKPLQEKFDQRTNTLDLGFINRGRSKEVTFSLIVRGEHAGNVQMTIPEDGITPADFLQAKLGEPRKNGKVQIVGLTITIPADAEPVDRLGPEISKLGKVVIETDHPTAKRVVIYVRFAIEG